METRRWRSAWLAGLGACLAIMLLGWLDMSWQSTLLMAPFGASCVLLFSLPDSPLARPQNVLGGHLLSATVGLVVQLLPLPMELKLALGVGLSIALMQGLGLIHPRRSQSTVDPAHHPVLAFPLANSAARRLAADHGESLRQAAANVTTHTHINNEGAKAPSLFNSKAKMAYSATWETPVRRTSTRRSGARQAIICALAPSGQLPPVTGEDSPRPSARTLSANNPLAMR